MRVLQYAPGSVEIDRQEATVNTTEKLLGLPFVQTRLPGFRRYKLDILPPNKYSVSDWRSYLVAEYEGGARRIVALLDTIPDGLPR